MNRRELRSVDIEALERAYTALAQKPDNTIVRFKIAKTLFDLGVCGHAMRIVEGMQPEMPPRFFAQELRTLKQWHMMQLEARYFTPIICSECQTPNDPGLVFCRQCNAPFLLNFAKGKVIGTRLGKKLMASLGGVDCRVDWHTCGPNPQARRKCCVRRLHDDFRGRHGVRGV